MRWLRNKHGGMSAGGVAGVGLASTMFVLGGIVVANRHNPNHFTPITACGTLAAPGRYKLNGDLTFVSGATCVAVNQSNTTIDCQNHSIVAFQVTNANNVTIKNCLMSGSHINLLQNTSGAVLSGDTFTSDDGADSPLNVNLSDTFDIGTSTFNDNTDIGIPLVVGDDGNGGRIHNNTFTSNSTSSTSTGNGADSAIALEALTVPITGVEVDHNTMSHFFGRGIETYSEVDSINVHDNAVDHAYSQCFAGFFWMSLQNTTWKDNTCDNSGQMFRWFSSTNSGAPLGGTVASFVGNTFDHNVNTNQLTATNPSTIDATTFNGTPHNQLTSAVEGRTLSWSVSGNVIKNNDYSTATAGIPTQAPSAGFSDGGGNHCNNGGSNANTAPIICLTP